MAKYEPKTKPTTQSAAEFIAAVEDPVRRQDALVVDAMMRRISGQEPRMWGPTMVGYGNYHYRYDSGHEGNAMRIGFSPRKAELVLYLLAYDDQDHGEEEALLARLGRHRRGKTCLYVKRLAGVDIAVLERLASLSWRTMEQRYPA